jgi:Glycosyl hydrolases family 2, TIM barrel domain/Glycosyl hydrolases family 2, sugar binding domain/Glycosyl hydrolases family 2
MEAFMEIRRRNFLTLGLAGVAATGLRPAEAAVAAASWATATRTMMLTGTDSAHTLDWDFQVTSGRNSATWSTIPTPSNWECQGFGTYNYGWNLVPGEKGLYRRTFTPPATWAGRHVFLVFEGSMTDTDVLVNGRSAGPTHRGGFYRFRYDVTSLVDVGAPNLLEVTVSKESSDDSVNNAERRGDYWNFGGIYRPVYLQAVPLSHIDRIAVDARASGALAVSAVLAGVTSAGTLTVQVKDLQGQDVAAPSSIAVAAGQSTATVAATIAHPRLWTAETPNLYQVEARLNIDGREVHRVGERFGFRTIEVRDGDGVYVNGHKVILKGTCRHSFWPTTGRATSVKNSRDDILLMKGMNNNAVRMSHYPPDVHFLDLCDELGLYVLDELAGWQKKYSTAAGTPLVAEMVTRDLNHPSILFWDNGNEGGFNFDLDDDFDLYDPQKRPVLHPWALFSGIDTDHYETYASTQNKLTSGNIFMPTEFLHGLYDGGAGAGLNDYWKLMGDKALPTAGGFLWAFVDEGVVRDDEGGAIDTAGNLAPDGILGPFRQKEGSYFTIKDIWCPIQLTDRVRLRSTFPAGFDGTIQITNRYDFTNVKRCTFRWELVTFAQPAAAGDRATQRTDHTVALSGSVPGPDLAPGASGPLRLGLPPWWRTSDALRVTAVDPTGHELQTWVLEIKKAADHARSVVQLAPGGRGPVTTVSEDAGSLTLSAAGTSVRISTSTGRLVGVTRDGSAVSLANGPALASGTGTLSGFTHGTDGRGHLVRSTYTGDLSSVTWRLDPSGWLRLQYAYSLTGPHDFVGVNFDYPETNVLGLTWLGNGPYRVWKNRMRGVETGVWTKDYNDTATGADLWKYPEFKGYHASTYWAALRTTEGTITLVTEQEDLFLRLFTPRVGPGAQLATAPFPAGGISLLDGIPPIGNKFQAAADLGPQSQKYVATGDYHRTVFLRFTR